jgi:hypothetical protein
MLRRVTIARSDVSEERIVSIVKMEAMFLPNVSSYKRYTA